MFLPIGDDNSARVRQPVVVVLLVAANVIVWLLQLQAGDPFTMAFASVPFELTHGVDLVGVHQIHAGTETASLEYFAGPHPVYLTAISAMFMHGSWAHLLGNMLYLWIFGDQVEDRLGHLKFLFFYLVCGIAATAAQVAAAPDSLVPCLGASGAIAGVLGAYLVRFGNNPVRVLTRGGVTNISAIWVLVPWIILQFVGQAGSAAGVESGVAYLAHIGGFISGVLLILVLRGLPGGGARMDWAG